jgi:hypothetical protein
MLNIVLFIFLILYSNQIISCKFNYEQINQVYLYQNKKELINCYLLYSLYDFIICNYLKAFIIKEANNNNPKNCLEIVLQGNYKAIQNHLSLNWKQSIIIRKLIESGQIKQFIIDKLNNAREDKIKNRNIFYKIFSNDINSIISSFIDENYELVLAVYNLWKKNNKESKEVMTVEILKNFLISNKTPISNDFFSSDQQNYTSIKKLLSLASLKLEKHKNEKIINLTVMTAKKIATYIIKIICHSNCLLKKINAELSIIKEINSQ